MLTCKQAFAEPYAKNRFNFPHLHAELLNRMGSGHIVVDHERITGLPGGEMAAVAVYEVVGGRIKTVWFF